MNQRKHPFLGATVALPEGTSLDEWYRLNCSPTDPWMEALLKMNKLNK